VPPERVTLAHSELRDGALAAGRDPAEVTVGVYVRTSFGTEPAMAMRALRLAVGEYASYPGYARQFAAAGLGAEATAAAMAHEAGRPDDVPEALVRTVCLTGDPAAARAGLSRFRDAGADLPVVYPVPAGDDPASGIRATLEALTPG
jgi:alkanesulfonate monooxygenase SsuD/methylene tetrahydromethanopterin reductase-like flavin-dependent oxidoreductase (luciferase family)